MHAAALVLASVIGASSAAAQGADDARCRATFAGTYLTTIRGANGGFASRSLVTIHGDGTLTAVDSRQHQGVQGSSFSAQQGAYRCAGAAAARARTLNFGFPDKESIARSDWQIAHDAAAGSISGTIALVIYKGVEGVDPFTGTGTQIGVFRFTSVRVTAPAK